MNGGCRNMREVVIPQEDWPAHLGPERAEQLVQKVEAGHKVEVKVFGSCDVCDACVMCNLGLRGLIGGGADYRVEERVVNGSARQCSGNGGEHSGTSSEV